MKIDECWLIDFVFLYLIDDLDLKIILINLFSKRINLKTTNFYEIFDVISINDELSNYIYSGLIF